MEGFASKKGGVLGRESCTLRPCFSTDEQARHGLSIDTQLDNLRAWAKNNGHIVVGEYVDAGISGKKPPSKRPELARFFADLDGGLAVDVLAFTKLDRLFRSVKLYYQAIDTLDKHKVAWQAIHEDYETLTAGGRMKVNIMLAVNENEADRTAERIKVVFDRKIERGEYINPCGVPIGLAAKDKHIVPGDDAEAAIAVFEYYDAHGSIRQTMDFLRDNYGIVRSYRAIDNTLHNRLYIGEHRDNKSFCEPLIDRELFDRVQRGLEKRSIRQNPSNRIYAFSGMIVCRDCGCIMGATHTRGENYYYRCQKAFLSHQCVNRHMVNEKKLERYLLDHIGVELDNLILEQNKAKKKQPAKNINKAKIQAKLDRLKELYVDGLITKEEYLADREKLSKPLQEAENAPQRVDYEAMRKLIGSDFERRYAALSRRDAQAVWRAMLDRIEIDVQGEMGLYFKQ